MSVRALQQTAGRGRNGRTWHSTKNDLAFSMLLPYPKEHATFFPAHVALVLQRALERSDTPIPIRIKWPNDLVAQGKKLAGILCENFADRANLFIAGIGVNVGTTILPPELEGSATSLALLGCTLDAKRLWLILTRALWHEFRAFSRDAAPRHLPQLIREYNRVAERYQKRRGYPGEVLEFSTLLDDGRGEFWLNGERLLLSAAD